MLERIDAWWAQFTEHADQLDAHFTERAPFDPVTFVDRGLAIVSDDLCWEFGKARAKPGHRLVITPETARHLRPLVDELVARAPDLERWEFDAHRVPVPPSDLGAVLAGRTGGTADDLVFDAMIGEDGRVDLRFASTAHRHRQQVQHDAFVTCEALLGERVLDAWVGIVEVVGLRRGIWPFRRRGRRPEHPRRSARRHRPAPARPAPRHAARHRVGRARVQGGRTERRVQAGARW